MNVNGTFGSKRYVLYMSDKNSRTNAKTLALVKNLININKLALIKNSVDINDSLVLNIPNIFSITNNSNYRDLVDEIIKLCTLDFPHQKAKYPILVEKTDYGPKVKAIGFTSIEKFYNDQLYIDREISSYIRTERIQNHKRKKRL